MASKCFMCGTAITRGILCDKCDKPRTKGKPAEKVKPVTPPPPSVAPATKAEVNAPPAAPSMSSPPAHAREATAPALDPFPKAPILPFPIDSASPAITSVADVLIAAGVPAIVVGTDRSVKFVTEEAKKLFDISPANMATVKQVEALSDVRIGDLAVPSTTATRIRSRNYLLSLVPLSGGASGALLGLRYADANGDAHASFAPFLRQPAFLPLRPFRHPM